MSKFIHVILSGGIGSRLWPLSRKSKPKQYIDLIEGKSLFDLTIKRNLELIDELIVVGNKDNYHLSNEILSNYDVKYQNIIESTPRNTAAAIAFSCFSVDKDDVLLITPSDHVISNCLEYKNAVEEAVLQAKKGYLVTFGIVPTKAETGYGYIEYSGDNVMSFREKPNKNTAEYFIEKGNFLWNSGMFCFKASTLLEELEKFEPQIYQTSKIAWESSVDGKLGLDASTNIPSRSIDYAVMEKSKKIKVVNSAFNWSDLGSFESIYEYLVSKGHPVDENGNMTIGLAPYTAFVGLKNTIFIHTKDANLILSKEHAQGVKNIYNALDKVSSKLLD